VRRGSITLAFYSAFYCALNGKLLWMCVGRWCAKCTRSFALVVLKNAGTELHSCVCDCHCIVSLSCLTGGWEACIAVKLFFLLFYAFCDISRRRAE
jgi:hypothetical protein